MAEHKKVEKLLKDEELSAEAWIYYLRDEPTPAEQTHQNNIYEARALESGELDEEYYRDKYGGVEKQ